MLTTIIIIIIIMIIVIIIVTIKLGERKYVIFNFTPARIIQEFVPWRLGSNWVDDDANLSFKTNTIN